MKIRILGIGMGPQHVTAEVARAIEETDYLVAYDKRSTAGARVGDGTDELFAVRQRVADVYDKELVAIPDPERDRQPDDYKAAVAAWHKARLDALESVLLQRAPGLADGGTIGFLAWGDPAFYDSTVRIVTAISERTGAEWDVLPGVSAVQLLAAKHRMSLHRVAEPVHITAVRRLPEALASGQRNIVAMLGEVDWSQPPMDGLGEWQVHWGSNLGAVGERLVSGRLDDVREDIIRARQEAFDEAGWVMDLCLLQGPK
ncbi:MULTISPECIES: precorrin 6A synthase [Luteococcus]|uniref:Precorrin-6A synthase n=1 Tax=Luteococcus japonicus LSP_Lj1 TaxID=1255658 RepID=A0A1R4JA06_9ACTN|nr:MULTISPECIES: precorrin 6A synthase [Luteococcus]MDN5564917.1 precorrin 6A synthase [Luteococcus sp.]SJN28543.1 Precorrin-6A synthase [Luteococcus japonicus LSP_Lj1]